MAAETPVDDVLDAVRRADREALRRLLHPYLRWTDRDGVTIHGRRNVIAHLVAGAAATAPGEYELRDGQIYRWREDR